MNYVVETVYFNKIAYLSFIRNKDKVKWILDIKQAIKFADKISAEITVSAFDLQHYRIVEHKDDTHTS